MIDDLIDDQGELALIIETDQDGDLMISGYAKPTGSQKFKQDELRAAYAIVSSKVCGEDTKVHRTLSSYFGALRDIKDMRKQRKGADKAARLLKANPSRWIETYFYNTVDPEYTLPAVGTVKDVFATKKYKPVAQKIRPITGGLPSEFRIVHEIKGDPLKDMPQLSTHPSEYKPMGRYTEECKEIIEKVHKEDFL